MGYNSVRVFGADLLADDEYCILDSLLSIIFQTSLLGKNSSRSTFGKYERNCWSRTYRNLITCHPALDAGSITIMIGFPPPTGGFVGMTFFMNNKMKVSVVIPVYNEADSLSKLYKELVRELSKLGPNYEIIFVDDGSRDNTQKVLEGLFQKDKEHVKAIQFRNNFGKAAALRAGFDLATGDIIITLDADLQDDPVEIPRFIEKMDEGYDLVSGWKQNRQDSFIKNNTSKIFNFVTNLISRTKLHDFNCGFKAYRAEVAKGLNLYGELHRYIPVIVASQGYKVTEIPISHRKREFGTTKYGQLRFIHGFLDLVTVLYVTRFRARPLHLFGYLGFGFFISGFLIGLYLTFIKFVGHQPIGERPLLLFSVMLMIMGVQIGATGLVGEHITTLIHKRDPNYVIKSVLGKSF